MLVANPDALLEANTGEGAVKIEPEVIPLPILEAEVSEWGATAVTTLNVPLRAFADGSNTVGDIVLLKLKRDRSVVELRRVSGLSEINHGLYAITDSDGNPVTDDKAIAADKVYLFVVGIGDDSELDWDMHENRVVDPLYTGLGSGGGGSSDSSDSGCSVGVTGAFAILAAFTAAYRVKRRGG